MSPFDLLQILIDHLVLSSRMQKIEDKIKAILVLPMKGLQSIFKPMLVVSSIEKLILNMVDCWGVIICVDGIEYFLTDYESFIIVCPSFERWIWKYFEPAEGETFVDVGAHIGKYALRVARLVGEDGRVIAVEADPINFQALTKGTQINGLRNVLALNLASWNKAEKLRLYRGTSSGRATVQNNECSEYIEVQATPLDKILAGEKVDWIKIDVEGAEVETLEGLTHTLDRHHPKVIVEALKCNTGKAVSFMTQHGYEAEVIYKGITGNHVLFLPAHVDTSAENAKE